MTERRDCVVRRDGTSEDETFTGREWVELP
jgi:hypothetical protein